MCVYARQICHLHNTTHYICLLLLSPDFVAYSILNLVNILDFHNTPKQAVMIPKFQHVQFRRDGCFPLNSTVFTDTDLGGFDPTVVKTTQQEFSTSRGVCFNVVAGPLASSSTSDPGYIATVYRAPTKSSLMLGAVDNQLNGYSEGVSRTKESIE